jgi:hypothetical protein
MSIEENNKIDIIGTRNTTGEVVLTISDHLDWIDPNAHLTILQEKLNVYIEYIEGGQIFEDYPQSKDKNIIIEIVSKENYPLEGLEFLAKMKSFIRSIGVDLYQKVLEA